MSFNSSTASKNIEVQCSPDKTKIQYVSKEGMQSNYYYSLGLDETHNMMQNYIYLLVKVLDIFI